MVSGLYLAEALTGAAVFRVLLLDDDNVELTGGSDDKEAGT